MQKRKLSVDRVMIVIIIAVAIGILELIGWGLSHILISNPNFWRASTLPFLDYLFIGILFVAALALLSGIAWICYLIYCWFFPVIEPVVKEENGNETNN